MFDAELLAMLKQMVLMGRILRLPVLQDAIGLPVVDTAQVPRLLGSPVEAAVYLIFQTERERRAATRRHKGITRTVHRILEDGGYPACNLDAVVVELASTEEIDRAGGRERYFFG